MGTCIAAVANGLRRLWVPPVSQVRFRFHKDKIAAGPLLRRYGYDDTKVVFTGTLPHVKHEKALPIRPYIPPNHWSDEKAHFGQNDYIDIFSGNIHPTRILYEVPGYLRGFKGNEFQCLLRKQRMLRHGFLPWKFPTEWKNMNKRIGYLYKYLNRKTRTWITHKSRMCS